MAWVSTDRTIHVLYENPDWLPPLQAALRGESLAYELHEVWRGIVDPTAPPAPGIYLNRMSPSFDGRYLYGLQSSNMCEPRAKRGSELEPAA